jgi:hypothetical protein
MRSGAVVSRTILDLACVRMPCTNALQGPVMDTSCETQRPGMESRGFRLCWTTSELLTKSDWTSEPSTDPSVFGSQPTVDLAIKPEGPSCGGRQPRATSGRQCLSSRVGYPLGAGGSGNHRATEAIGGRHASTSWSALIGWWRLVPATLGIPRPVIGRVRVRTGRPRRHMAHVLSGHGRGTSRARGTVHQPLWPVQPVVPGRRSARSLQLPVIVLGQWCGEALGVGHCPAPFDPARNWGPPEDPGAAVHRALSRPGVFR